MIVAGLISLVATVSGVVWPRLWADWACGTGWGSTAAPSPRWPWRWFCSTSACTGTIG